MYGKSQTGPDKLWFKTTNGAGIYRVTVNSSSTYIGPASAYSLSACKNPQVSGINQTLQKLITTEANTIYGEGFTPNTTVSMFLDGGNQRDILATLDLPVSATAATVAGNRLWLNSNANGLEYYSLEDPQAPVKEGDFILGDEAYALTSHGNFLYTTFWNGSSYVVEKIDALSTTVSDTEENALQYWPEHMEMDQAGNHLCVLTRDRIVSYDPDDLSSYRSNPRDFSSYSLQALAVNSSYIYVVSPTGIHVFNFYGSQFPIIDLSSYSCLQDMSFIDDNTALVATSNSIIVMDLSQYPGSGPDILAEVFLDTRPEVLQVQNNRCYVAGTNALEILDISDPANPLKIGYTSTPETEALALLDDIIYLSHPDLPLSVVDVATPSLYQAIGRVELSPPLVAPFGWASSGYNYFTSMDNHLYAVTPGEEITDPDIIHVIDITDPENLSQSESIDFYSNSFYDITSSPSGYLALSCDSGGLFIQFLGGGDETYWYNTGMAGVQHTLVDPYNGDILWVADDNGIFKLEVTRSGVSNIDTINTPPATQILKVTESHIYALVAVFGIIAIDKATGQFQQPQPQDWLLGGFGAWKIAMNSDGKLIIGSILEITGWASIGSVSISIYDFSGDDLVLLSNSAYSYPYITNLSIQDDRLYLSSQDGLTTIDISDAASPAVLGTQKSLSSPVQAEEISNLIYTFGSFGIVAAPMPEKIATTYVSPTKLQVSIPAPMLDGHYTLSIHNGPAFTDLPGAITFTDVDRLLTSKAIIVAGRNSAEADLVWTETQAYVDRAYANLRFQGYAAEDIVYLSAAGPGGDVDDYATYANLQNAIAAITNGADPDKKDLLLYMVDHGGPGTFQINENESLAALDLDEWLDALQNSASADNQVVVVNDACSSASFLRYLKPPSGKNRITMSSSDVDQSAYFLNSSHSFSAHLWTSFSGRTGETVNLSNGFWQAADMMAEYQTAQLDADGDGVPNEPDDETALANLENGHLYAVRRGYSYKYANRPVIAGVTADQTIDGINYATLSVSGVYDADGIGSVFAVIIPPDFVADPDLTVTDQLGSVELNPDGLGGYDISHPGFDDQGAYIITYYAVDSNGI